MTTILCRRPWDDRVESIHWDSPRRSFWIGRTGLGLGGSLVTCNAHFNVWCHPWRRWSRGDYKWVDFFKQIARGLREFVRG